MLLIFLGGRMIIEGFRGADDEDEEPRRRHGFWLLVTTAIATSLDAFAVGISLRAAYVPLGTACPIIAVVTLPAVVFHAAGRAFCFFPRQ